MSGEESVNYRSGWQKRLFEIVYESDTIEGKLFDLCLIFAILLSMLVVIFDSVSSLRNQYGPLLKSLEWIFTILFTIEYLLRILAVTNKKAYLISFLGIVDLLSFLPTYLSVFIPGAHTFLIVRGFRLLRLFRVLKMIRYVSEAELLAAAIKASIPKIVVFLLVVTTIVVLIGALMYFVEGPQNGFVSIPVSMYWTVVTLTTVGYGDITPSTTLGRMIASLLMIVGYGILAVPTGIVTVEMVKASQRPIITTQVCPVCMREGHDSDAVFCKFCGEKI